MKLKFHCYGNIKQKECIKAYNDENITEIFNMGSKGGAKSFTLCSLIFYDALTYPGTHYFIARNQLNDLRKHTTATIREVLDIWKLDDSYYKFNGQDNVWNLHNGSKVFYVSTEYQPIDPEYTRFGSAQYTRGGFEEIGEQDFGAYRNLSGTVGRWKNNIYKLKRKTLAIGNPCQNFAYDYYKAFKDGALKPYQKFIETDASDNKMISDGYYEGLEQIYSPEEKDRLIFNNWNYSNDPAVLCQPDAIQDIFTNDFVKKGDSFISADLAMQGRDRFIAAPWSGLICNLKDGIDQETSTGLSIETDLKNLMLRFSVPHSRTVVDSDGMGSYLESYLTGIKAFYGVKKAVNDTEFTKFKAECGYKLAELINKRKIKIICNNEQKARIIRELGVLKSAAIDGDEKRKGIISKKIMKKLLGSSPDYLDMLLMRMAFEINKIVRLNGIVTNKIPQFNTTYR